MQMMFLEQEEQVDLELAVIFSLMLNFKEESILFSRLLNSKSI